MKPLAGSLAAGEPATTAGGDRLALLLLAWVASALVLIYWQAVEAPATALRIEQHEGILSRTIDAPYRYRVLGVWTSEVARSLTAPLVGDRRAFHLAYLAWNLAGCTGLLTGVFALLRTWFRVWPSLAGALCTVPALLLSFGNSNFFFLPWSTAEGALAAWALLAALRGRGGTLIVLTAVATLNRETGLLVALLGPTALAGARGERWGGWVSWAPLLAWVGVYGALRVGLGSAPASLSVAEIFALNRPASSVAWALLLVALFLGPLWIAAARGARSGTPVALRRAALTLVPMAGLFLAFAVWREVRVLLPVLPLLVTLAAWGVAGPEASREGR